MTVYNFLKKNQQKLFLSASIYESFINIINVMIIGKVFLEAIKTDLEVQGCSQKYKINIVANDVYYDQLKQFHTKYLCLTQTDTVTFELIASNTHQLVASTSLPDILRLILQSRTADLQMKSLNNSNFYIKLVFSPVLQKQKRKSPQKISPSKRTVQLAIPKQESKLESSAKLSLREKTMTLPQEHSIVQNSSQKASHLFEEKGADSLKSLAQQRQKILGQLFGKFKRDN